MAEKKKFDPASKRNFKLVGGAIGVGLLFVLGSLFVFSSDNKQGHTEIAGLKPGQANLEGGGQEVQPSPEYNKLVTDYNRGGAEAAERTGGTFVPVLAPPPQGG